MVHEIRTIEKRKEGRKILLLLVRRREMQAMNGKCKNERQGVEKEICER